MSLSLEATVCLTKSTAHIVLIKPGSLPPRRLTATLSSGVKCNPLPCYPHQKIFIKQVEGLEREVHLIPSCPVAPSPYYTESVASSGDTGQSL